SEKKSQMQKSEKMSLVYKILGGVVAIVALFWLFNFVGTSGSSDPLLVTQISESDHVKGNRDAKVVLIEYSDFQCPACGHYYEIVKDIEKEYGKDIAIVYRHFPLMSIHPYAETAARASEVAAKHGKFWKMHDELFENQNAWSKGNIEEFFKSYAKKIGLDEELFMTELSSGDVKSIVRNHYRSAMRESLNSTPSFFLNGKKLPSLSPEDMKKLIESEIKKGL
ncbi:thioredoxin domain-containing protein, partial [Candidatus Peregrinibacteria bacterium]|nr:thioredoxin domain-containing protein [Candidatus Peregrinibacteria bacterium]